MIGIGIGYLLAAYVSEDAVALTIGMVAVSFALRRLVLERGGRIPQAAVAGRIGGAVWGAASGFTSRGGGGGPCGWGRPSRYTSCRSDCIARSWVGTGAIFFAILNVIKVAPFFALGQFSSANLTTSLALFPLAVASTIAGSGRSGGSPASASIR